MHTRQPEYFTSRKRLNDIISVAFRQPEANSHCSNLHGYALTFEFIFAARTLNEINWVVDFGKFKQLTETLKARYDHKTVISVDEQADPHFSALIARGVINPCVREKFSMELLAQEAAEAAIILFEDERVALVECVVYENGKNAASANYVPHWFE